MAEPTPADNPWTVDDNGWLIDRQGQPVALLGKGQGDILAALNDVARLVARAVAAETALAATREERDALQAMVDCCRELVAEHDGDLDGDRPIDSVAAIVGYPTDVPDQPNPDEQTP